ncbi:DUF1566 domain-containing protein [Pseudoalteromonas byunsanensis]|uniref:Lcl C-terminal domain-containing protein n=1 Tax=Pseudoalteromonas byunsanensis TaxID=327939 RepID=A0A1S1N9C1_9GAMM|nr:DUF1566 domain-containing protein [Pseudoalteromonas byunsanensis]OHU95964.1 hypothetical protein BIW53_09175 [Pseudoalteromonas byunsanensis]
MVKLSKNSCAHFTIPLIVMLLSFNNNASEQPNTDNANLSRYHLSSSALGAGGVTPTVPTNPVQQEDVIDKVTNCNGALDTNIDSTINSLPNCRGTNRFKSKKVTVSSSTTENGQVTPHTLTFLTGQQASFTITANAGYEIASIKGCKGKLLGNTFRTSPKLKRNCDLKVSFSQRNTVATSDSVGSQRTLVALVNFPDNNEKTITLDHLKRLIRDNPNSLNHFLIDNSNGKSWIDAEFLDWTTLEKQSNYYFGPNSTYTRAYTEFQNDVVSSLAAKRDLTNIDRLIIVAKDSYKGSPGCYAYQSKMSRGNHYEYSGYLMVLSGYDMGCNKPGRIAHEYGHTLGFAHSLSYRCTSQPSSLIDKNNSQYCEGNGGAYSHYHDTMGSDYQYPLYSSVWRAMAGWFDEEQVKTVTQDGTYTLRQSSMPSEGVKLLQIPIGFDGRGKPLHYFIELRSAAGNYDKVQFQARRIDYDVIVRNNDISTQNKVTNDLVDYYWFSSVINQHKPFVDKYRGVSFSVLSVTGEGENLSADIKISVPKLALAPSRVTEFKGSSELRKSIAVRNISNENVAISDVEVSGRNATAFSVELNGCGSSVLSPNEACDIVVKRDKNEASYGSLIINASEDEAQAVELFAANIQQSDPYDPNAVLEWQAISKEQAPKLNWSDAKAHCNSIQDYGHTDWRLPHIEELRDAIQRTQPPLFVLELSSGSIQFLFWALTGPAHNPLNAYVVYGNGTSHWMNSSKDDKYHVVCARTVD